MEWAAANSFAANSRVVQKKGLGREWQLDAGVPVAQGRYADGA
jgi:hypothetical protein